MQPRELREVEVEGRAPTARRPFFDWESFSDCVAAASSSERIRIAGACTSPRPTDVLPASPRPRDGVGALAGAPERSAGSKPLQQSGVASKRERRNHKLAASTRRPTAFFTPSAQPSTFCAHTDSGTPL